MSPERGYKKFGVAENRQGKVRSFNEMCEILKNCNFDLDKRSTKDVRYVKRYFHTQKLVAEGNVEKARKIFSSIKNRKIYENFEDNNQSLLLLIDVAVKGKSRLIDY